MKLRLELNAACEEIEKAHDGSRLLNGAVLITPPVGQDYWLMRVMVSESQAVIAFPKFGTLGVGFLQEEDWNTNLPYRVSTEELWRHIRHNKGDATIPRARCLKAIRMIQA